MSRTLPARQLAQRRALPLKPRASGRRARPVGRLDL